MEELAKSTNISKRRISKIFVYVFGVLVFLGVVGLTGGYLTYANETSGSAGGHTLTIEVYKGDSFSGLGTRLQKLKVIKSVLFFDIYIRLHQKFVLLPGLYTMNVNDGDQRVVDVLKAGPNEFRLTVIPGMTLNQIATQVGHIPGHTSAGFLKACSTQTFISPFLVSGSHNLEGLLSPDTYFVLPDESNHQVIQEMINQTATVATRAGLKLNGSTNSLTPYQELIVASLVQREALIPSDYAKVARVIYNRLAIPMNLQFDSTVLYGLGLTGGSPTLQDLAHMTPYNTYLVSGLPPTPISAPSYAAILAAVNPAPGPWIYFVTTSANGSETFSVTYQQQLANEAIAAQKGLE